MEDNYIPTTVPALLSSPVGVVLKLDVIILESDATVDEATKLMKDKNSRSVLVSNKGEVVGIVSKTDILFKVSSQNRNPTKVRIREIMTSPVLAVGPNTTVKEAHSIMDKRNVRQIMVHAYAAVLGMVTREDILQQIETISVSSHDTALNGTPVCILILNPYLISKILVKQTSGVRIVNLLLTQKKASQNIWIDFIRKEELVCLKVTYDRCLIDRYMALFI